MKESYIAAKIDLEYKRDLKFKEIKRQKCMENEKKLCNVCRYKKICEDVE